MRRNALIAIIFGLICFVGIIVISSQSAFISNELKTIGFIVLCYLGVISFSYGWLKRKKNS